MTHIKLKGRIGKIDLFILMLYKDGPEYSGFPTYVDVTGTQWPHYVPLRNPLRDNLQFGPIE